MSANYLPSIWISDFRAKAEYDQAAPRLAEAFSVYDWIDDHLLESRHAFQLRAYCAACEKTTQMRIVWSLCGVNQFASVHPAWTEIGVCQVCGLNSRMRALMDFLRRRGALSEVRSIYLAEQITPLYQKLKKLIPSLVGSEFLGPEYKSGKVYFKAGFRRLRHEDLAALSFPDSAFELALTLDVFEHMPDYRRAFAELYRVLKSGGRLVFTIPFFFDLEITRIRASLAENKIIHHLPPEIHGNPLSNEGALCFQNFGWDILSELRQVGFADAVASLYWGPWQGHLGYPFFVFSAEKGRVE